LVSRLVQLLAVTMRDIKMLGDDKDQDYLSKLVLVIVEDFKVSFAKGNSARIAQFAQVGTTTASLTWWLKRVQKVGIY
jgi:hypothetical protein